MVHRIIRFALMFLGVVGVLIGLGSIAAGVFVVRPQVQKYLEQTQDTFALAERALSQMDGQFDLIESALRTSTQGMATVPLVPELLTQASDATTAGAGALASLDATLGALADGLSSLAVPDEKIERNAKEITDAARELRQLGRLLNRMESRTNRLEEAATNLTAQLQDTLGQLPSYRNTVQDMREQLSDRREALEESRLEWAAAAAVALFGGMYLLLGMSALALLMFLKAPRVLEMTDASSREDRESGRTRRAA